MQYIHAMWTTLVWPHHLRKRGSLDPKSSSTPPPLFIAVSIPSQESGISFACFYDFSIVIWRSSDCAVFCFCLSLYYYYWFKQTNKHNLAINIIAQYTCPFNMLHTWKIKYQKEVNLFPMQCWRLRCCWLMPISCGSQQNPLYKRNNIRDLTISVAPASSYALCYRIYTWLLLVRIEMWMTL